MYGPYPGRPHFTVAGVPVHVSMWHIVLMGVLFYGLLRQDGALGTGVILIASFSVLLHELGHAFVSRYFRLGPRVALTGFGGLCYHQTPRSRRDEFLISAAGPAANFALAGLCYFARPVAGGMLGEVLAWGYYVNLFWGGYNLLPIYPLDGGVLTRVVLGRLMPRGDRADRITHWIGVVLGGALGLWGLLSGQLFVAVILGFAALENWRMLQLLGESPERHKTRRHDTVRQLLARAHAAYGAGRFDEAARLCHQARAEPFVSLDEMQQVWHILALAAARQSRWEDAIRHAKRLPDSAEMARVRAVCLLAIGDTGRARTFLDSPAALLVGQGPLESLRQLVRRSSGAG